MRSYVRPNKTVAPWTVVQTMTGSGMWLATSKTKVRMTYFRTWREAFDYAFERATSEAVTREEVLHGLS